MLKNGVVVRSFSLLALDRQDILPCLEMFNCPRCKYIFLNIWNFVLLYQVKENLHANFFWHIHMPVIRV